MEKWFGASGLCMNDQSQLLMVLQGAPGEPLKWSLPSGGKEPHESFEACCMREIQEETGYLTKVVKEIKVKRGSYEQLNVAFEVHYFLVELAGGAMHIQDPDDLIKKVAWISPDGLKELELTYPEDCEFILDYLRV